MTLGSLDRQRYFKLVRERWQQDRAHHQVRCSNERKAPDVPRPERTYITPMPSRLFAVLRTLLAGTLFASLWTFFAPRWMAMSKHVTLEPVLGWHLAPMLIRSEERR